MEEREKEKKVRNEMKREKTHIPRTAPGGWARGQAMMASVGMVMTQAHARKPRRQKK